MAEDTTRHVLVDFAALCLQRSRYLEILAEKGPAIMAIFYEGSKGSAMASYLTVCEVL